MNFIISEITSLRYVMPLIIEGNKHNINSTLFLIRCAKYTNPYTFKKDLNVLAEKESFRIEDISSIGKYKDINVVIEGTGRQYVSGSVVYSLMCNVDYLWLYQKYINEVDHVVFPSKWFETYPLLAQKEKKEPWNGDVDNCIKSGIVGHEKNIFLGSPKYDVVQHLNREDICKKYDLDPDVKYGFVFYPRNRRNYPDIDRCNFDEIVKNNLTEGLTPLVKSRIKDPFKIEHNRKYKCFYDVSWYPPTALELIYISEEVLVTDSSGVKEAVMLNKPVNNVSVKSHRMLTEFYEKYFKKNHLYDFNSSERILQHMKDNYGKD